MFSSSLSLKDVDFSKINKLQMNMHPYSWSKEGLNNLDNTIHVVKERTQDKKKNRFLL